MDGEKTLEQLSIRVRAMSAMGGYQTPRAHSLLRVASAGGSAYHGACLMPSG